MGSYVTQKEPKSIKETFDTVAAGYDNRALRFFQDSADKMAGYFNPGEKIHLLDVATGTGNAALTIAAHLPLAKITGVDFSPVMLAQARAKAKAAGLGNVEFLEMDMQALEFPAGYFDAAVCAFGIFFVEDMEQQLMHIAEKVNAGGKILISCFYENSFSPCVELFLDRIEHYGIERPPLRWKRIATEAGCIDLFSEAGLKDIRVDRKNLGYYLESAEKWWDVIWNGGFRGLVEQLSVDDMRKFKTEHVQEIEALHTDDGIWLNLEVLHTVGVKK
jgi:ubiquinone/menaquinone biosynthesis C-methylase UbiE